MPTLPATQPLVMYSGDTFAMNVQLFADATPINVAGWTFAAHIRTDYYPGGSLVGVFAVTVEDAALGKLRLVVSPEVTAILPRLRSLVWDLEADEGDMIRTWLAGNVNVERDVTREA